MRRGLWVGLVGLSVLAACGGDEATPSVDLAPSEPVAAGRDFRIVVVTHGQPSDPFWTIVANGVTQARDDLGVEVEHVTPPGGAVDVAALAQLIDTAVASAPDGLVISNPDPAGLTPSIQAAVAAGIPVLSIQSGGDAYAQLGLLTHIGQADREAGLRAGQRLAAEGVTNAICLNEGVGNPALDLRCQGLAEGLGGIPSRVVPVNLADGAAAQAAIAAELAADPTINGILTVAPGAAAPAVAAVAGNPAIRVAGIGLSQPVLSAIDAGQMSFATDEQPYLQGYLGVSVMTLYLQYGLVPGGGDFLRSGPAFVTQQNAARVMELGVDGIR